MRARPDAREAGDGADRGLGEDEGRLRRHHRHPAPAAPSAAVRARARGRAAAEGWRGHARRRRRRRRRRERLRAPGRQKTRRAGAGLRIKGRYARWVGRQASGWPAGCGGELACAAGMADGRGRQSAWCGREWRGARLSAHMHAASAAQSPGRSGRLGMRCGAPGRVCGRTERLKTARRGRGGWEACVSLVVDVTREREEDVVGGSCRSKRQRYRSFSLIMFRIRGKGRASVLGEAKSYEDAANPRFFDGFPSAPFSLERPRPAPRFLTPSWDGNCT